MNKIEIKKKWKNKNIINNIMFMNEKLNTQKLY